MKRIPLPTAAFIALAGVVVLLFGVLGAEALSEAAGGFRSDAMVVLGGNADIDGDKDADGIDDSFLGTFFVVAMLPLIGAKFLAALRKPLKPDGGYRRPLARPG